VIDLFHNVRFAGAFIDVVDLAQDLGNIGFWKIRRYRFAVALIDMGSKCGDFSTGFDGVRSLTD
jgi:hypothetical protein